MVAINDVYSSREEYSKQRIEELRLSIQNSSSCANYPELTIIGAGSYARLEASEFSDIDVFFLCSNKREGIQDPRTAELQLFSSMIEIIEKMNLPKFSNDCEYLDVLHADEILQHLGGPLDDHKNFFTARMLLLLESKCLYGDSIYHEIINKIIESYFQDFYDHKETFQPIFLLNDICRFWKTMLLNYESRRQPIEDSSKKTKQRVRNFKLKFSRMTTCYASIAELGSYTSPVTKEQVIEMIARTPRERLQKIPEQVSEAESAVNNILEEYAWFLEMTGLPMEKLESHFVEKKERKEMFLRANKYGDLMFELIKVLDTNTAVSNNLMRYLVI